MNWVSEFWGRFQVWMTENGLDWFITGKGAVGKNWGDSMDATLTVQTEVAQVDNALETRDSTTVVQSFIDVDGSGSFDHLAVGNDNGSVITPSNFVNVDVDVALSPGLVNAVLADMEVSPGAALTSNPNGVRASVVAVDTTGQIFLLSAGQFFASLNDDADSLAVAGLIVEGRHASSVDTDDGGIDLSGIEVLAQKETGSSTVGDARGVNSKIAMSAGTITEAYGVNFTLEGGGGIAGAVINFLYGLSVTNCDLGVVNPIDVERVCGLYIDNSIDGLPSIEGHAICSESTLPSSFDGVINSVEEVVTITILDSPYTPDEEVKTVLVDASGGDVTVLLPAAPGTLRMGRKHTVKKIDATSNDVLINGNGVNVDFLAIHPMNTQGESETVQTDQVQWWLV